MVRHRRRWADPTTPFSGTANHAAQPTALYQAHENQLADMLELVCSGRAFAEPATAERLAIRLTGALMWLHRAHRVNQRGRCAICQPASRTWWWPWRRRGTCTVSLALSFYLRQPDQYVLTAINDHAPNPQGPS
ncbi:MAG TPA: hypothetical protein VFO16_22480 [Pseudonocardiaceae bacterium]|nr:hypothetical protein [Pseudonocardiaceae bacterium]